MTSITAIRDNLQKTISGKEMLLDTYRNPSVDPYPRFVKTTMIQMLETNIKELNSILADVNACVEEISIREWSVKVYDSESSSTTTLTRYGDADAVVTEIKSEGLWEFVSMRPTHE